MIIFKVIRWKNLLSTGNTFTEIQLNRTSNTLILGSNGAGKSTVLDALCFVLFNKPFRKINKPGLLNSINNAECVVEIEFSIGNRNYKVVRGIKPNVFEIYCNEILLNQDAKSKDYQDILEKTILKFNYKSFTQIVILGSASFVPFMQLKAGDRREIIEDLLDIQIFTAMNNINKDMLSAIKDSLSENKYSIDLVNSKITLQKSNIEENKKQNHGLILEKQNEIKEHEETIQNLEFVISSLTVDIEGYQDLVTDVTAINTKTKKMVQLEAKMESNVDKIAADINFYEHGDNCPTCKQIIDPVFKAEQLAEHTAKRDKIQAGMVEIAEELQKLYKRASEINETNSKITKLNNTIIQHSSTVKSCNRNISTLEKQIKELSKEKGNIQEQMEKLAEFELELDGLTVKQSELLVDRHHREYAATLLKDTGIKTRIIKQYLPVINKYVNKYLSAMGFFVNFNLNENFEETIKSRHRDDFEYANFSEGEKQKISLAIIFAWRQISKIKNSTNTNLLILDEVFDSSLDGASTELLMGILKEIGNDTNVFVISHKTDQLMDNFRSVITFEKKNNFSQMVK